MTPQEKYDSDRWFVMRKIKEQELYNSPASSGEVRYYIEVTPFSKFEEHPPSAQISILRQLASEGVIEILHEENKTGYGAYFFFTLRVIRPKFDELYLSYEKSIGYKKDVETEPAESSASPVQKIEIIGGKLGIEGLEKGLETIAKANREEKKNKFPHKLPAGTEWKNFIIQFVNKNEIFIQVNRFKHSANYSEMGFADNRFNNPQPNAGWTFLWVLAKFNGELTIKDQGAKDTYKKQKSLVSEALKSYFSMESDPFYPYQETKSYKTRFTLLSPPEEAENIKHRPPQKEIEQDSVDEEIRQFFNEHAPQVYDEKEW